MAFKLNEKTLEPHNGDYIAFLKEIEKGNAKVSGLTVSVNSDMPGMVTVRRANESDQAPSSPGFIAKNKNAMPALLRLAGSVIALFGVPVGMFVTFGGLVCALSQHQKLERLKRLVEADKSNNE